MRRKHPLEESIYFEKETEKIHETFLHYVKLQMLFLACLTLTQTKQNWSPCVNQICKKDFDKHSSLNMLIKRFLLPEQLIWIRFCTMEESASLERKKEFYSSCFTAPTYARKNVILFAFYFKIHSPTKQLFFNCFFFQMILTQYYLIVIAIVFWCPIATTCFRSSKLIHPHSALNHQKKSGTTDSIALNVFLCKVINLMGKVQTHCFFGTVNFRKKN